MKAAPGKISHAEVRSDFPILSRLVHGKPLAYLDNGATSLKPRPVIEAVRNYYLDETANIHRGVHFLSESASARYETVRDEVRAFIGAEKREEIIFTHGATESINLVAQSYGRTFLKAGDEILVTHMEHHANIVPWQMLCTEKKSILKVAPINDNGELLVDEFESHLSEQTKFVSFVWISNVLGTINPVEKLITLVRKKTNALILVDASQAVQHQAIDVKKLDIDFLVFSGHKVYAPTGVGVLYGKEKWLEKMPPFLGGGDMIRSVSFEGTTYNDLPFKFEAGTPGISAVFGLGSALQYLQKLGWTWIEEQERSLLNYLTTQLLKIDGLKIYGPTSHKAPIVSFTLNGAHPSDIGMIVDREGVAIRTGSHCAEPLLKRLGLQATARASLAFYNQESDIDALVRGIHKVKSLT
jgi:cysteine desulfurase/selenocysteine lyase